MTFPGAFSSSTKSGFLSLVVHDESLQGVTDKCTCMKNLTYSQRKSQWQEVNYLLGRRGAGHVT